MKVIIAGSRTITSYQAVKDAIAKSGFEITEVVSGGARGVDHNGKLWAIANCLPYTLFLPDWTLYGRRAGFIRNREMAAYADALIALWDGCSRGTAHMLCCARERRLPIKAWMHSEHAATDTEAFWQHIADVLDNRK